MARKPEVGEIVGLTKAARDWLGGGVLRVVAVFNDLDEDWGDYGEFAWAMWDYDRSKRAEFYVIVEGGHLDKYALASWEVAT